MRAALPAVLDRAHERAFVAGYAWVQRRSEAAGMRATRRELVARASGRTLEVGAGTGLNLEHYGPAVDELWLVEPAPAMREVLDEARAGTGGGEADDGRRTARRGDAAGGERPGAAPAGGVRVVAATGEHLPVADGSIDTVVGTFVLCSVADPAAVLREVSRVLRPGGRYLGLEHVRSSDARVARAQGLVAPAWRFAARGCRCDQDAVALVEASPLVVESTSGFRGPRQPWPVRPGVTIVARRP